MASKSSNSLFPSLLHDLLSFAEESKQKATISWLKNGRAFKVHNRPKFEKLFMKTYFNQSKFKSFQRQLNLWGFVMIKVGSDEERGAYYNEFFRKDKKDLCVSMKRVKIKGNDTKNKMMNEIKTNPIRSRDQDHNSITISQVSGTDEQLLHRRRQQLQVSIDRAATQDHQLQNVILQAMSIRNQSTEYLSMQMTSPTVTSLLLLPQPSSSPLTNLPSQVSLSGGGLLTYENFYVRSVAQATQDVIKEVLRPWTTITHSSGATEYKCHDTSKR